LIPYLQSGIVKYLRDRMFFRVTRELTRHTKSHPTFMLPSSIASGKP
jgi:hypothetical protein